MVWFLEGERTFFDELEEEERMHLVTLPPENAYEELIRWTKEKKIWSFPVDNEWGKILAALPEQCIKGSM
jgi:hypothetical protein